jgi:hypothetical protein
LAARGANMTRSYGVTHPSQPNYIGLFSGSLQGVTTDGCPTSFAATTDNLGHQLRSRGLGFTGYAEALPRPGYTGCSSGTYRRKHNPWVDFANVPTSANQPFSSFPSSDFAALPTVSFVSPDMCHSMHDCSVSTGDSWLKDHLDHYARWAMTHNSLLVITFDENEGGVGTEIPTVLVGGVIRPGNYAEPMNHYTLLRTLEEAYGLPVLANAGQVAGLRTIWAGTHEAPTPAAGVQNQSFELALTSWTSSGATTTVATTRHGGTLNARAGRTTATSGDSVISQTFVVPAGKSTLSVWWLARCHDVKEKAWATIIVHRNTSHTLSSPLGRTCTRLGSWRRVSVPVTAGHSYTLDLINHDDGVAKTPNWTYFDDVSLS